MLYHFSLKIHLLIHLKFYCFKLLLVALARKPIVTFKTDSYHFCKLSIAKTCSPVQQQSASFVGEFLNQSSKSTVEDSGDIKNVPVGGSASLGLDVKDSISNEPETSKPFDGTYDLDDNSASRST